MLKKSIAHYEYKFAVLDIVWDYSEIFKHKGAKKKDSKRSGNICQDKYNSLRINKVISHYKTVS